MRVRENRNTFFAPNQLQRRNLVLGADSAAGAPAAAGSAAEQRMCAPRNTKMPLAKTVASSTL